MALSGDADRPDAATALSSEPDRPDVAIACRSVVVVPARDEEARLPGCLRALAAQTVGPDAFETIVIADACRDGTAVVAASTAAELGLRLWTVPGPGRGAGAARRLGMELAADHLLAAGRPEGLIASTDADSRPAPDWLQRQLDHLDGGAEAVAGRIELCGDERAALPAGVRRRRDRNAADRLERVRAREPDAEHHHFSGSSIGITAATYRRVGGLAPLPALEDAAFSARLQDARVPVRRAADVRVDTSARSHGRVARGLSVDLEVSLWAEHRRFCADDYSLSALAELRERAPLPTTTVVIPTRECAETIAGVIEGTVAPLARSGVVDEIVVVDAGSRDGTADLAAAAGARVIQQDEVQAGLGPALGKGDALWRALSVTGGEIVCFVDGDTRNPSPRHLAGLLGPILAVPDLQLVKGAFHRPLLVAGQRLPDEGGRVTELTARPLINLHEPRLAGFAQPLAGEFAARRRLLEAIPFPVGYGIEIAVLIDALRREGLHALAECDLGERHNRHQPLRALGEMAYAVLVAVQRRCAGDGQIIGEAYLRPWDDFAVSAVPVQERPPIDTVAAPSAVAAITPRAAFRGRLQL